MKSQLVECTYVVLLSLIRAYKWVELQILKLFSPWLQRKGKEIAETIGVVFHCPGDPEWTVEDEKRVLGKCKHRYESLVHLKINDTGYFPRMCNSGTLASGETFMEKWWEPMDGKHETITEYAKRVVESELLNLYWHPLNRLLEWVELCAFNLQTLSRSYQVGKEHYDLGNDLYELMLDPWLQYTCSYWKDAKNLNEAQENKLDLIARKLDLKRGMRVLDIGCGFGTLCKYLAQNYGVECVGVTISEEQAKYGRKICQGLPVEIRLQDYRDVDEKFDRIVSVGMFEHVGQHNYDDYFEMAKRCLTDSGLFLLHTIARSDYKLPRSELFLHHYIFPNGQIPDMMDIAKSMKGRFVLEDWSNFAFDYARTLDAWRYNFVRGWPAIQPKYGDKFFRMWIFYLSTCAGIFESGKLGLWQIVMSKRSIKGYRAVR